MGTNYYLRLKEPRMVAHYDEMHIAKCSGGWKPIFQAVTPNDGWNSGYTPPSLEHVEDPDATEYSIHSVADIKSYLATGRYEVVDEYGEVLTPEQFEDEVLRWGNKDSLTHQGNSHTVYHDPEGYEFERNEFS